MGLGEEVGSWMVCLHVRVLVRYSESRKGTRVMICLANANFYGNRMQIPCSIIYFHVHDL